MVDSLVADGYTEYYARWALYKCDGDRTRALAALEAWGSKTRTEHAGMFLATSN